MLVNPSELMRHKQAIDNLYEELKLNRGLKHPLVTTFINAVKKQVFGALTYKEWELMWCGITCWDVEKLAYYFNLERKTFYATSANAVDYMKLVGFIRHLNNAASK